MNSKYADLPDIDTAPDIYETEDLFLAGQNDKSESSDEETSTRQPARNGSRHGDVASREELDTGSLVRTDEASRYFRKAEKKQYRSRLLYTYPSSPSSRSSSPEGLRATTQKPIPLSRRLRNLQAELSTLERELSDPSNPLLQREREENVDPGELLKGLVDVRGRIEKIRKDREGRGKLIGVIVRDENAVIDQAMGGVSRSDQVTTEENVENSTIKTVTEIDRRLSELENIIGSSSLALDEMTPMPCPLLPLMTRLNNQLMILTQPRHVDSISRRLKLLISDLDRLSLTQQHRRQNSQTPTTPSPLQGQLFPVLARLGTSLPQIPHILTRLRTLSALHGAAGEFQTSLKRLEEEGSRIRDTLRDVQQALDEVEESTSENRVVIKANVTGLENRIDELTQRINSLSQ